MATYHNITEQEIRSFLTPLGFQPLTLPNTKEIVFGKRIPHTLLLTLRVYTGINPDGNSRGVGEDAIRVNLFWKNNLGEIKKIGGSKRVHRVNGWMNNLRKRLNNWDQEFVMCSCGAPMVERKGPNNSLFYGCANYPNCRCTRPIKRKVSEETGQTHAYRHTPLGATNSLSPEEMRAEEEVLRLEQQYS